MGGPKSEIEDSTVPQQHISIYSEVNSPKLAALLAVLNIRQLTAGYFIFPPGNLPQ